MTDSRRFDFLRDSTQLDIMWTCDQTTLDSSVDFNNSVSEDTCAQQSLFSLSFEDLKYTQENEKLHFNICQYPLDPKNIFYSTDFHSKKEAFLSQYEHQSMSYRLAKRTYKTCRISYNKKTQALESQEEQRIRREDKITQIEKLAVIFKLVPKVTLACLGDAKVQSLYTQISEKLEVFREESDHDQSFLFNLYLASDLELFLTRLKNLGLAALQAKTHGLEILPLKCHICQKDINYLPVIQNCYHSFHFECINQTKGKCIQCVSRCVICFSKIKPSDDPKTIAFTENWKVVHEECLTDYNAKIESINKNLPLLQQIHPTVLSQFNSNEKIKSLYKIFRHLEISEKISETLTKSSWKRVCIVESHLSAMVYELSSFLRISTQEFQSYRPKVFCFICSVETNASDDVEPDFTILEDFYFLHKKCISEYPRIIENVIERIENKRSVMRNILPFTLTLCQSLYKTVGLISREFSISAWKRANEVEKSLDEVLLESKTIEDKFLDGWNPSTKCTLCLEEDMTRERRDLSLLRCYHLFHSECINVWRTQQMINAGQKEPEKKVVVCLLVCPYCKQPENI